MKHLREIIKDAIKDCSNLYLYTDGNEDDSIRIKKLLYDTYKNTEYDSYVNDTDYKTYGDTENTIDKDVNIEDIIFNELNAIPYLITKEDMYAICCYLLSELAITVLHHSHITKELLEDCIKNSLTIPITLMKEIIKEHRFIPDELIDIQENSKEIMKLAQLKYFKLEVDYDIQEVAKVKYNEIVCLEEELLKHNYEYIDYKCIKEEIEKEKMNYDVEMELILGVSQELSTRMKEHIEELKFIGYKSILQLDMSQQRHKHHGLDRDRIIKILCDYFNIEDTYAYNLTRDKSGFVVGTVTIADFEEFDEHVVADLANYIIKNY